MATTTSSDKVSAGISKSLPLGYKQSILASATIAATAGANDIFNMIQLTSDAALGSSDANGPGGPTVLNVEMASTDIDGGASVTLSAGDAASAARYLSNSTIGQAGGRAASTLVNTLGYQPFATPTFSTYTTPSLQTYMMQIKVTTSAATALAGTLKLLCDFTIDP